MNVFYKPGITGDEILLDPAESSHCIKVMRYSIGDRVQIIDGRGGYYEAVIANGDHKACKIRVVSCQENYEPLPYELNIAIAPTKNMDRFEWFVEKATEIGVTSIIPIICGRSERRNLRVDRLEKIAISAIKQSVKSYLPKINDPVMYEEWITGSHVGRGYIAHCSDGRKDDFWKMELSKKSTVLIGPEGDFTEEELNMAYESGFLPVSLGNYRLRTETAGVVACAAVSFAINN